MAFLRYMLTFVFLVAVFSYQTQAFGSQPEISKLTKSDVVEFLQRFETFIEAGHIEKLTHYISQDVIFNYFIDESRVTLTEDDFRKLREQHYAQKDPKTPIYWNFHKNELFNFLLQSYVVRIHGGDFQRLISQLSIESNISVRTRINRKIRAIRILDDGKTAIVEQRVAQERVLSNHIFNIEGIDLLTIQLEKGHPRIIKWTVHNSAHSVPSVDLVELTLRIVIITMLTIIVFILFQNNRYQTGAKLLIILFLMTIIGSIRDIHIFFGAGIGALDLLMELFYIGYPCILLFLILISFNDTYRVSEKHHIFIACYISLSFFAGFLKYIMLANAWYSQFFYWFSSLSFYLFPIPICLYCFYITFRDWKTDLVETRRKFRFVVILLILLNLTFLSINNILFLFFYLPKLIYFEKVTAIVFILILSSRVLKFDPEFFEIQSATIIKQTPKPEKNSSAEMDVYLQKLEFLMTTEKTYCQEGLTIGKLALFLQLQEYRLRQLINQKLGYRNFNDYLNQFRMNEAAFQLTNSDTHDKPILEIALDIGYKTMTNFNKIFKEKYGVTPRDYRKNHLNP